MMKKITLVLILLLPCMAFGQSILSGDLDRPIPTWQALSDEADLNPEAPDLPDEPEEPESPDIPDEPESDPPTFMGEEIEGSKIVFVIDASLSMRNSYSPGYPVYNSSGSMVSSPTRWQAAQSEAAGAIAALDVQAEFDVILFGGIVDACFGSLSQATASNKMRAIAWIFSNGLTYKTVTYDALLPAFNSYGKDLDTIMLMTDGQPYGCLAFGFNADVARATELALNLMRTQIPTMTKDNFKFLLIHIGGVMFNFVVEAPQIPKVTVVSK